MRKYLLVDDNRAFAENLAEILRETGDEAHIVSSGAEALRRVGETRFDAMLTDMKMPEMSGAQLVHEIRSLDPGLPVLVVTAYTGEEDLTWAKREGVLAVLPKPVPIQQMIALLTVAKRDGLVAVVEDDVGLCDNLVEALRDRGFTAVTARSTLEAVGLRDIHPFAALVDLRLPGSPRGEVVAQLAERFVGLPLLVMTGFPEIAPKAAFKVFAKPFATAQVLATLEGLHRP